MTADQHTVCNVSGCSRERGKRRGMCDLHYRRWIEYGSTDPRRNSLHKDINDRLWNRVDKRDDGCWIWTGATNNRGYGVTTRPRPEGHVGRTGKVYAHRLAWEEVKGPIPDGMDLDHLCHVVHCVNPDHLRPVTAAQNNQNLRGANSRSKTGIRNVYPGPNGFIVQVKHRHIGCFATLEEAAEAAQEARARLMPFSREAREPGMWCALCSHPPHEPGECFREIQTHTKPPTWQDCPCIHQRRHP